MYITQASTNNTADLRTTAQSPWHGFCIHGIYITWKTSQISLSIELCKNQIYLKDNGVSNVPHVSALKVN